MTELEQLPVDQRAALSLLLGRGMSYAAVAGLLTLDQATVRDRALAALARLEPVDGDQLAPERRGEIGDYLLGQQPASQRALTRQYLSTSPAARTWARIVASRLAPLSDDLPEIPPEGRPVDEPSALAAQRAAAAADAAYRSSRRGGIVALGALAVVVAAVIVIVLSLSSSSKPAAPVAPPTSKTSSSVATQMIATTAPRSARAGAGTTASTTTTTGTPAPHIIAQITFAPPDAASRALAVANVMSQGTQRAFALRAQGLAATHGFAYAVWLYNSETDALPLGFIDQRVTASGRAEAVGVLPANAVHYRELVITRETTSHPAQPGPIVLAGELALGGDAPGG